MNKRSQEIATANTDAKQKKKKRFTVTQRITYLAMLTAIALVLKIIGNAFQLPFFKITFDYIPWIITAVVFGPLGGMTVAFATDLLGTLILGQIPNPIFALSNALFGLIMGLVFMIPKLHPYIKLAIATAIIVPLCTMFLGSLALALLYSKHSFWGWFAIRTSQIPVVVINSVITAFLFPVLKKKGFMK